MGLDNVACVFHPQRRCRAVEVTTRYPLCDACALALEEGQITWPAAILRAGVVRPERPDPSPPGVGPLLGYERGALWG